MKTSLLFPGLFVFLVTLEATTLAQCTSGPGASCSMLRMMGGVGYTSPYYSASTHPGNNPHNLNCHYRINAQSTSNVIKVLFRRFNLEHHTCCNYDYVAVYEGVSTSSRLIGKYCGRNSSFTVQGRGPYMYIHYHTDRSVHSTGFQFRFSVSASATPSCDQLSIGGGPGTGFITSPNYPSNYPHKADCRYRINAGSASRTITLRFTAFNLESHSYCRYDFVEVRKTINAHCAPNARKYCGTTLPATQVITGQQYVYIHFFTDNSVARSGFRMQWTVSGTPGASCSMPRLTGGVGYTSPYYSASTHPGNNPHNLNCHYRINAQSTSNVIKVLFRRFNLEHHTCCNYDYVAVYEGVSTSSRLIGKYCGRNSSFTVQGRGPYMYIHYHTDRSVHSTGFQFRFSVSASATPSCDQLSIGGGPGTGFITSPNYPSNYPHKADCRYRINAGSASRTITLRFTAFNLESHSYCRYDFVEVRKTINAHCAPNARKYCGTTLPATQVITGQQYVYIHFFTDNSVARSGFRLQWTVSGGSPTLGGPPTCGTGYQWTRFYNRDLPSGNCDCENFRDLKRQYPEICNNRASVDVVDATTGIDYRVYGQVVNINTASERGFSCFNRDQPNGQRCRNYKIRFCCPISNQGATLHI
uniref:cubilin-like isoform X2 n=1 Tax=Ciona intestinalis TaxID=7719 RepID=UPI000EF45BC4|nr:cubilin-like isoform X2 [Ciona intestinalis]|eukprot:XP_026696530.1 cubilin-like isoform X2 [Ciona intestinalis]